MKFFFFLKFEFFNENQPPTHHIKNKKIDFVPCNKSIMANKLRSTNLRNDVKKFRQKCLVKKSKFI